MEAGAAVSTRYAWVVLSNEEVSAVSGARRPQEPQDPVIEVIQYERRQPAFLGRGEQAANVRRQLDQVVHRLLPRHDVLAIRVGVAVPLEQAGEPGRGRRPDRIGVAR